MTITAKVICDSVSKGNRRLTTLELEYPRYIHSEFMTHRVFSRNAQSSRAIPLEKTIENIRNNPVLPIWMINQRGMAAEVELIDSLVIETDTEWLSAMEDAIRHAENLSDNYGIHKQIVNRLLEPFSHIKVLVSATEWDNFFKLRLGKDAQQEIQLLAKTIKLAMDSSTPNVIHDGEYHLPFITLDDEAKVEEYLYETQNLFATRPDDYLFDREVLRLLKQISVARCAGVSYRKVEQDYKKCIDLYNKLLFSRHMSPFEHVATPVVHGTVYPRSNFKGWVQHRHEVE